MSGIDYGNGKTNIDPETGIRYGVIPAQEVDYWDEQAEADYGEPTCPKCGGTNLEENSHTAMDYFCKDCKEWISGDDCYPDSPLGWIYKGDGIRAEQGGDSVDIFVTKSPFYTWAPFCSPCAPGACYLLQSEDDGEKAYCFGHDWFEGEIAPYPVYRVDDDSLVPPLTTKGS